MDPRAKISSELGNSQMELIVHNILIQRRKIFRSEN